MLPLKRGIIELRRRGWPALGLLLVRIAAAPLILGVLAIADGAILIAGLWTPLAGNPAFALSAAEIRVYHENQCPGILLAAMGAGVAFVGRGALSIDARIFGMNKIDIDKA